MVMAAFVAALAESTGGFVASSDWCREVQKSPLAGFMIFFSILEQCLPASISHSNRSCFVLPASSLLMTKLIFHGWLLDPTILYKDSALFTHIRQMEATRLLLVCSLAYFLDRKDRDTERGDVVVYDPEGNPKKMRHIRNPEVEEEEEKPLYSAEGVMRFFGGYVMRLHEAFRIWKLDGALSTRSRLWICMRLIVGRPKLLAGDCVLGSFGLRCGLLDRKGHQLHFCLQLENHYHHMTSYCEFLAEFTQRPCACSSSVAYASLIF